MLANKRGALVLLAGLTLGALVIAWLPGPVEAPPPAAPAATVAGPPEAPPPAPPPPAALPAPASSPKQPAATTSTTSMGSDYALMRDLLDELIDDYDGVCPWGQLASECTDSYCLVTNTRRDGWDRVKTTLTRFHAMQDMVAMWSDGEWAAGPCWETQHGVDPSLWNNGLVTGRDGWSCFLLSDGPIPQAVMQDAVFGGCEELARRN